MRIISKKLAKEYEIIALFIEKIRIKKTFSSELKIFLNILNLFLFYFFDLKIMLGVSIPSHFPKINTKLKETISTIKKYGKNLNKEIIPVIL